MKHDFLHHFKMPRCDLVWILVTKLATTYYTKLNKLLTPTGRDYRDLCSWRKQFKQTWRKLETREITLPINDAYRPNGTKWTCTCPFFATSRFLICKHLIQSVHRVPATFFKEVKCHRSVPFWRHASLKDLDDEPSMSNVIRLQLRKTTTMSYPMMKKKRSLRSLAMVWKRWTNLQ